MPNGTGSANDNSFIIETGVNNANSSVKDLNNIKDALVKLSVNAKSSLNTLRKGFDFNLDTSKIQKSIESISKIASIDVNKSTLNNVKELVETYTKLDNKDYVQSEALKLVSQEKLNNAIDKEVQLIKGGSEQLEKTKESSNAILNTSSKISDKIKNIVTKVISLRVAIKGLRKVIELMVTGNKSYGTFIETLNLAEVSFQENAEAVVSWSKDYADSLGLSYNEVLQFSSKLKSLADSMGIANEVGTEMSTTLTTLIYNIASLRNLDFEQAYSKIESTIFSGQLRTARTIGVDISVASMQALVEELGYAEIEYKNLTEAQKVQLRTIKVLRDLGSQSAGDLEKTLASTSNRIRILKSSWENLLTVIGNATDTVFSDLLAYVIGAVQGLSRFIQDLKPLTQSTGLNNTAKAMGDVETSLEGVNEQLGLLQIDKFETLAGAGDKKNSLSFDTDLDNALSEYNKLNDTMQNVDKTVKKISDTFYQMFQNIDKEVFNDFAKTLGDLASKLPDIVTGFVKLVTNITNLFLKLYEGKALIPFLVGLGLILAGIKAGNWIVAVSLLATGAVLSGVSVAKANVNKKVSEGNYDFFGGDLIKSMQNSVSKASGVATSAIQGSRDNSNIVVNTALNINDREFANATYNAINYTNQRYTGTSLGGSY